MSGAERALQALGLATAAYTVYKLYDFSALWLLPKVALTEDYYHGGKDDKGGPKAWALVTGASAGIGLGIAQELALLGFGVVLLGHQADELKEAAESIWAEVEASSPSSSRSTADLVRTVVMDATTVTNAEMDRALLGPVFGELNVTILVNNVGGQPAPNDPTFQRFDGYTAQESDNLLDLNSRFMMRLTRLALPSLISAATGAGAVAPGCGGGRRRTLVLNMASAAGKAAIPGIAPYSASKAFVVTLSRCLSREMAADGLPVDFVCVAPGDVASQGNTAVNADSPTARQYAGAIVGRLGRAARRGQKEMAPWFGHAVQIGLVESVLPAWAVDWALVSLMRDKAKRVYGAPVVRSERSKSD